MTVDLFRQKTFEELIKNGEDNIGIIPALKP